MALDEGWQEVIEEFLKQGIGSLLSQGTGWIIAVILGALAFMQNKQIAALYVAQGVARALAETAVKEQYEKRLEEFREILDALSRTTSALDGMQETVEARTEAINQLVVGFAKLVRDLEVSRERWNDKGEGIMRAIEALERRIENMRGGA